MVIFQFPDRVEHGGRVRWHQDAEGRRPLDFSANLNPFPPDIPWKPDPCLLTDYPDDTYHALKSLIARHFHRDEEEITLGNGSIEVLRSFCYASIQSGDLVRIDPPTFGEYALSAGLAGGRVEPRIEHAKVWFICNPNNPTGTFLPREALSAELEMTRREGGVLCIDEAFIELAGPQESLIGVRDPSLFILRSLTKSFAVPGLRFGFGVGDPDLIARMEVIRPPWNVNAFAADFARVALSHYHVLEESMQRIAGERAWLTGALRERGIELVPPSANFILLHLHRDARRLSEEMLAHGVLVRDCTSFGLPQSIRIAVRTREENRVFLEAFDACMR
ncbi:MAG: histidinol-phosphate transaminase [Methanomicrobiaceae archaeon]|nr:histidinol-phosphate transaminase [Methanomicrobiaceae archaeon]